MSDYFTHLFPLDPNMPKSEWAKLQEALLSRGVMVENPKLPGHFDPGPTYRTFCTADPHFGDDGDIAFEDYGDKVMVVVGDNIVAPPKIPGTTKTVEDWVEFIDRWVKNTDEKWTDPAGGQSYGLFDLDWKNTLGAGKGMLTLMRPGYLDAQKLAAFATEITGYKFSFSYSHI